jgi:glycogen operon protein
MFVAGDEIRRTQQGNNNAYCQDNVVSWFDWQLVDTHPGLFRFWKGLIAFRKRHATLHRGRFFSGVVNERGLPDVSWHGTALNSPGWDDPQARALACTLGGEQGDPDLHVMMNMYWDNLDFELPTVAGRSWFRALDTSQPSPNDIADPGKESPAPGSSYTVQGRSIVVLVNR